MNIVIISASMRAQSQSLKVSTWLQKHVAELGAKADIIDLHAAKLPVFDPGETEAKSAPGILAQLDKADGVVFVSPEWNGMMSHGLVNMLHFVGQELAHKPVMTVGVSATRGGTYPVAHMRLIGHKNKHYVISPEALIVQDVASVMNESEPENEGDTFIRKRADYALKILIEYAKALKDVRSSGVVDLDSFPHGV